MSITKTILVAIFVFTVGAMNAQSKKWEYLLKEDFKQWDIFMGVPHAALKMPGYEDSNGKKGVPLGLNNDPKGVFSMAEIDGKPVLKISGEIYAGLSTKASFENYHLSMQFKWGDKKYAPRTKALKDSGLLYHARGDHGSFWNVWLQSLEFQVQETDCGDYYTISQVRTDIPATKGENGKWMYDKNVKPVSFGAPKNMPGNCKKSDDNENPMGEWNTLELICLGDTSLHIVNGKVMMALYNAKTIDGENWVPLKSGKIQIQSEGAEVFYKDIKIKKISKIKGKYKKQM